MFKYSGAFIALTLSFSTVAFAGGGCTSNTDCAAMNCVAAHQTTNQILVKKGITATTSSSTPTCVFQGSSVKGHCTCGDAKSLGHMKMENSQ